MNVKTMKKLYSLLAATLITSLSVTPASAMKQYVSGNVGYVMGQ
jgi:hypothetical protein